MSTLFDRLFSRAIICESGCWEFCGFRDEQGYGAIGVDGKTKRAHRVSFDLVIDDVPDDMDVLHWCNNPPCVNPGHLYLGNDQDNTDYKIACNRQARLKGEENPRAILNEIMVRQARRMLATRRLTMQEIADELDVGIGVIQHLALGKTWSHLSIEEGEVYVPRQIRKLTEDDKDLIRQQYAAGEVTQYHLAAEWGVAQSTISKIITIQEYLRDGITEGNC